ncbi:MAG: DNA polymerase IV [Pseudomonadota bacterium]
MRKFIHVDMDAFYVSVEIRDNPDLANKPVAVGGRSRERGVLSTCNYIAREFGLHSAMPTAIAVRKCPDVIIVPGRMSVYKEVSLEIREIFKRYTELIEPLSLDEAYLDVTESQQCKGSATLMSSEIRQAIFDQTRLTASAGIAPLKFIAKVASDLNKPNGQFVVSPEQVDEFISELPLSKIPGVGKVTFEKLKALGWLKGADIRRLPEHEVVQRFGKFGTSLWKKCQGIDYRGVNTSRIRKSVGVERTFSKNMKTHAQLEAFLFDNLMPELLRRAEKYIETNQIEKLGVKIKFQDFQQTTKEQKYDSIDENIFKQLLSDAISRGNGKEVRLLGIHIGLTQSEVNESQLTLNWN